MSRPSLKSMLWQASIYIYVCWIEKSRRESAGMEERERKKRLNMKGLFIEKEMEREGACSRERGVYGIDEQSTWRGREGKGMLTRLDGVQRLRPADPTGGRASRHQNGGCSPSGAAILSLSLSLHYLCRASTVERAPTRKTELLVPAWADNAKTSR